MTYELHENVVRRLADNAFIPMDPANRDYQEYLEWLAKGNVPLDPPIPEPVVPQVVSRFQAKMALHAAGLLEQVEQAIAADGFVAQMAWDNAQEFHRNSPTVAMMAELLELSEAQLDALFTAASEIIA